MVINYLFSFFLYFYFFKYKFIYFNWRLITLQYCIGFVIYMEFRKMGNDNPVYKTAKQTQMYRTVFGLCGRGRGWDDLGEWH